MSEIKGVILGHKTRDIYLAAYCALNGCDIKIETSIGGNERASFLIHNPDAEKLKVLVGLYFRNEAMCNVKTLKHKITDVKNQLYSVIDNRKGNFNGNENESALSQGD